MSISLDILTLIGTPSNRRSTFGYCVLIGGNLVSWKSNKHSLVAQSSVEVEYQAMTLATCELVWIKQLLRESKFREIDWMQLLFDNQAALLLSHQIQYFMRGKSTLRFM